MARRKSSAEPKGCYCGRGEEYTNCCGRYLQGAAQPATAEQLMRSRYCGFVLCDETYILSTWHPSTRPGKVSLDGEQRWLGLSIRGLERGGPDDDAGNVEFVARFKKEGKGHRLHEISRFEKMDGRWYYLDGQHL
jgi:SEC-C motif-containing protein